MSLSYTQEPASGPEPVRAFRGEELVFSVTKGPGSAATRAEWYLNGSHLRGHAGLTCRFAVPSAGSLRLSVVVRNDEGTWSDPLRWRIDASERPRLLYVNGSLSLLDGGDDERSAFLHFIRRYGFNQLAIYRLREVIGNASREASLIRLIRRAAEYGIDRVFAVVGSWRDTVRVRGFLRSVDAQDAIFGGLLTEREYWNVAEGETRSRTWREYLRLLAHNRALADEHDLVAATYLGWFEQQEARTICELTDLLLLHAYVQDPAHALRYLRRRITYLEKGAGAATTDFWPILSAEPEFTGEWLSAQRDIERLELAERVVLTAHQARANRPTRTPRLAGFAWFARTHLS